MEENPRRLIRRKDLLLLIGMGRTKVEEMVKAGEFPKPIKISDRGRAVAWFSDEIVAWQKARDAKSRGEVP
jgi:prophage regulatory protein